MKMDPKTSILVAIGASTAANCTGCLEETVSMARELGAMDEQIGSAIEIGKCVRDGASAKLDPFALTSRYHAFEISRLLSM
jgi:AhpD family alkylhydroperoxidase